MIPTSRADLTIMEEATELLGRREERRRAAHDYLLLSRLDQVLRDHYPEISFRICPPASRPTQMVGAMIKTYYAEKTGIDPKDIVVVSVMPCTAKKYEVEAARAVPHDGHGGRGRGHHHPRAGPDDQASGH